MPVESGWSKGLLCAAALIGVQTSIGLLFKFSQTGGKYAFSQASSLALTELLKLLISIAFFEREVRAEERRPALYDQLPLTATIPQGRDSEDEDEFDAAEKETVGRVLEPPRTGNYAVRVFQAWKSNVSMPIVAGFGGLAVMYALNNHTMFLVYRVADPGTVQLVKSSSTLISAAICFFFLGRSLREMQWYALLLQTFGLLVTQTIGDASVLPISTYALLLGVTTVSATAGVANDFLCKQFDASLHAENMVLYMFGVVLNLLVFIGRKATLPDEPDFFTGYDRLGAILLIFLNASVGVVITFVYKYADAIVKGLATSVTTAILLIISIIFFALPWSASSLVGCLSIFLASWAYVRAGQKPASNADKPPPPKRIRAGALLLAVLLIIIGTILAASGIKDPSASTSAFTSASSVASSETVPDWHPSVCQRKALPTKRWYPAKEGGKFDDVLLIVFWNQVRYEGNRDMFEQVYGEYFSNMVFVGPEPMRVNGASADHMFDIWTLDSSSELTHRKLLAAMETFPCYRGYMWAGFDAFLNVPRLELFDQDRVWATIPDGERVQPETYVGGPPHAPVVNIGPTYPCEAKEDGSSNCYWWFPKAYDSCYDALQHSTPLLRSRLQNYTRAHDPRIDDDKVRMLWTMADFAYIPHSKRQFMIDNQALFMDCFLEIGLPTALATSVDEGESTQFVEYYNMLFNASSTETLIQDVWNNGGQVDFFHQINWRMQDPDHSGNYIARPGIVDRMKEYLAASRKRIDGY
ncbi:hypothetical protein JCM8097_004395 [Rhodosporidiobolus ruineniae]